MRTISAPKSSPAIENAHQACPRAHEKTSGPSGLFAHHSRKTEIKFQETSTEIRMRKGPDATR